MLQVASQGIVGVCICIFQRRVLDVLKNLIFLTPRNVQSGCLIRTYYNFKTKFLDAMEKVHVINKLDVLHI